MVEAHDRPELERSASAQIVGVNARDLGTFDEDLGVGERLVAFVPADVIAIARARSDLATARRHGEHRFRRGARRRFLVKANDPTATVCELASLERRNR